MPLYDYQCDQCGHRFEVRQGIKEDPLTTCPQCGGRIRRVIHPVGIVFKGSGFYVTDSRKSASAATSASTNGAGGEKKAEPAPSGDRAASSTTGGANATSASAASGSSSASGSSGSSSTGPSSTS